MNNDLYTNSKIMTVDEEQLKTTSGIIKQYAIELDNLKKQADSLWEKCSVYLDDNILNSINTVKDVNNKKYLNAINELNNYADKMESVSNIWKDAETEIKVSSKRLESLFSDISKTITDAINNSKR